MPLPQSLTFTLPLLALPPTLYYTLHLYHRLSPTFPLPIHSSDHISPSLTAHPTVTTIVNPANHPPTTDSRGTFLPLPQFQTTQTSDRAILTRFTHGFFGGRVFALERGLLWLVNSRGGGPVLKIGALGCGDADGGKQGRELGTGGEIRAVQEWEVGMKVMGAFQVVDVRMDEGVGLEGDEKEEGGKRERESESYVDFVFGSDVGILRGVHRFTVVRSWEAADGQEGGAKMEEKCELRFEHLACDPRKPEPLKPDWFQNLHLIYAMLLFREGLAEVLTMAV